MEAQEKRLPLADYSFSLSFAYLRAQEMASILLLI
jgi:hypothetical protein